MSEYDEHFDFGRVYDLLDFFLQQFCIVIFLSKKLSSLFSHEAFSIYRLLRSLETIIEFMYSLKKTKTILVASGTLWRKAMIVLFI